MAVTVKIPDLQASRPIVDREGRPQFDFLRWINSAFSQLEEAQNAVTAALEAAGIALDAAAAAQAAADAVTGDTNLSSSYVTGLTLEAFNDGADCHVDISAHTRVYGDGTSVPVNGGTLSGITHDTVVRVYYDQPSRAGGAVTYQWSSLIEDATQAGDRHSVGSVVTPRTAEVGSIIGSPVYPPGYSIP